MAVRNPEAVAERLAYYLRRNPHDGKYFGVRVDRDARADPGGDEPRCRPPDHVPPQSVGRGAPTLATIRATLGSRRNAGHGVLVCVRISSRGRALLRTSRLPYSIGRLALV